MMDSSRVCKNITGLDPRVSLVLVFMGMFALTGVLELIRNFFYPFPGMWLVSFFTMVVVGAGAAFIAFFPLRSLRAAEARLETLLGGSPVPQFVIDSDHRIIYWNRALEKVSGITAQKMCGTTDPWRAFYKEKRPTLADLLVDGSVEKIPDLFADPVTRSPLIDGSYETLGFFPGIGENGIWFHFTASPVRDTTGTILGAVESFIDVTRRKRAEEVLAAQKTLLEDSMELAHMAYWYADVPSGTFIFNDRFYALYGTTAEREGGYRMPMDVYVNTFIHPEDRSLVGDRISASRTSRGPTELVEQEHRIIRRDGAVRYIRACVRSTRDEEGRLVRTNGANQDITEQKQAEIALRESEARFLAFISEAAMRLKNPLDLVEGNLGSVVGSIEKGNADIPDITLQLRLQIKNLEQIRNNINELNRAIVDRADGIPEALKKFLTE
jgi:PAS domain S-box-containing protein